MRAGLWICAVLLVIEAGGAEPGRIRLDLYPHVGQLELSYMGARLAVYEFRSGARKPGLRELDTLLRIPVLLDSPEDPPQHRGVGLGLSLQGVNFSDEVDEAGWQQSGREISRAITRDASGRLVAEVGHSLFWVADKSTVPRAEEAWLLETRQLRFLIDETVGEVAVDWSSDFEVGTAAGVLTLHVPEDQGFVLRLTPALEGAAVGPLLDSALPGDPTGVSGLRTNGMSLTGEVDGRPVTVAVFGDTSQTAGVHGYSRLEPSALLAVHPAAEDEPRVLQPGDRFRWHYLVVVRPGVMDAESLKARRMEWLRTRP